MSAAIQTTQPTIQPTYDPSKDVDATNGLVNPNAVVTPVQQTNPETTAQNEVGPKREIEFAAAGTVASIQGRAAGTEIASNPNTSQPDIVTTQSPVNFDAIAPGRQSQLDSRAEELIDQYASSKADPRVAPNGTPLNEYNHRVLDYHSFKNILTDLKNDRSYSDNEKAYVWSQIASAKGHGTLTEGWRGGTYRPSIEGSNPSVRDSDPLRSGDAPGHTVLSFTDSYHGFGGSGNSLGMGYQTRAAANARIDEHETPSNPITRTLLGFNHGDANASKAMVAAFHAYRDAADGHRFESFANSWINNIVAR
jgi:hypothetical protein